MFGYELLFVSILSADHDEGPGCGEEEREEVAELINDAVIGLGGVVGVCDGNECL